MKNGKRLLKTINQNKFFLALFSIFLSLLLIVGSTYSWITYSDEYVNQSKANRKKLSAVINGDFTPEMQCSPGITINKKLSIKNDGQVPAIVRVSLYEFLAQLTLDLTDGVGNGNLKIVTKSSGSDILLEKVSTWEKDSTYKVATNKYFVVSDVHKSNKADSSTAYIYKGSRSADSLKQLAINFNDNDIYYQARQPATTTKNYWYYADGYFYYSEILQPKSSTKQLVKSVSLNKKLPNKYKGSLYQLVPVMEAHDITKSLLEDWGLSPESYIGNVYRGKVY